MSLLDLTLEITPKLAADAQGNEKRALVGHLGTHFDVMNKEFPLEYTERPGVLFDVRNAGERDVEIKDVELARVFAGCFVAFYSGYIERVAYGSKLYYSQHPQLSHTLIDALLDRGVSIIVVDFAGVRRGSEHTQTDQRCADRGTFVVENLYGLGYLLESIGQGGGFAASTYPMRYSGMTGLPCRVVARF